MKTNHTLLLYKEYCRHSRRYCNAPKPSKDPEGDICELLADSGSSRTSQQESINEKLVSNNSQIINFARR